MGKGLAQNQMTNLAQPTPEPRAILWTRVVRRWGQRALTSDPSSHHSYSRSHLLFYQLSSKLAQVGVEKDRATIHLKKQEVRESSS